LLRLFYEQRGFSLVAAALLIVMYLAYGGGDGLQHPHPPGLAVRGNLVGGFWASNSR